MPIDGLSAVAVLQPGVRVLSPSSAASLIAVSETTLVFNGEVGAVAGQIIVVNGAPYKVVSVLSTPLQTTVTVTQPALEEVFSKLRIKGQLDTRALSEATIKLEPEVRGKAALAGKSLTISPFSFALGPFSGKTGKFNLI